MMAINMSAPEASNASEAISLADIAARYEVSPQTLRRLCDTGQMSCTRDSRGWKVEPKEVESYLLARRPAGRQSVALWLQGPAPNPRLRDGVGWLFKAAGPGGQQILIQIWFSNELVEILQHEGYDVRDLVVRGAERFVSDALLDSDGLTPGQEILYGTADHGFILRAAGMGDDTYLSSEAPVEEGISVMYEFSPRDFAQNGVWPGDTIDVGDGRFCDVVVDIRSDATTRRVRTIRVPTGSPIGTRAAAIQNALRAYERRCQHRGRNLGSWVIHVATRSNALTLAQQRVLEVTCECWRKDSEWPLYDYVERRIDREYDLVLKDVLATVPPGLVYGLSLHGNLLERLTLTIPGLVRCESATSDVELFIATLGYLAQRQREFLPSSATQVEHLVVESDDVRSNVDLAGASPPGAIERLYDFLMQDPFASRGGGKSANGAWTVTVGPEIRRYRGVQTVQDYLGRRQPEASVSDQGSSSPPQHVRTVTRLSEVPPDVADAVEQSVAGSNSGTDGKHEVFVLMPFAPEYGDVWQAIQHTNTRLDVKCIRADGITQPGRISQQIVEGIRAAAVIIADITGNNPNVMFELGYADALGKPIVVLNQNVEDAPFDLKDWRQIPYATTRLDDMKVELAKFLRDSLIEPRGTAASGSPDNPAPPADRPILDIRGSEVPGNIRQVGQLTVKNVGSRPALECRAIIQKQDSWFVSLPITIGTNEQLSLAAMGRSEPLPVGLSPGAGHLVIYRDPEGWVYRRSGAGADDCLRAGMEKPAWGAAYALLPSYDANNVS